MTISAISDAVTTALHSAIGGLNARQQAIASNIANVETPGFQARMVNFEDSLRAALNDGDLSRIGNVQPTTTESLAPTRLNGNNVNIDFEIMAERENILRQKLVVQALNSKYSMLRTAVGG